MPGDYGKRLAYTIAGVVLSALILAIGAQAWSAFLQISALTASTAELTRAVAALAERNRIDEAAALAGRIESTEAIQKLQRGQDEMERQMLDLQRRAGKVKAR